MESFHYIKRVITCIIHTHAKAKVPHQGYGEGLPHLEGYQPEKVMPIKSA